MSKFEQETVMKAFVRDAADEVRCAAHSRVPVLITGRLRVERERLTRLIHDHSSRCRRAFVSIRCDVLHVRDLERLLEAASGGTLLLDEIGEMKRPMQNRLYSHFEHSPGASAVSSPRAFDVRIIAGASRSLRSQIAAGTFSEDLFYRLNVIHFALATDHPDHEGRDARATATSGRPPEHLSQRGW